MANFIDWSNIDVLGPMVAGGAEGTDAITKREVERLAVWFRDKWKQGPCPVCAAEQWIPNSKISHVPNNNTLEDGTVFPVLFIFCSNCGYSLPINVRVGGIRIDEPKEPARTDEDTPTYEAEPPA